MPTMRQQPRLVYQPHMYQRLIDLAASPSNALELCVGTMAEMTEGNIYEAVDQYSKQGKNCLHSPAQRDWQSAALSRNVHR
jgi:mannonate dehydratase